jgi:hypothetical protein
MNKLFIIFSINLLFLSGCSNKSKEKNGDEILQAGSDTSVKYQSHIKLSSPAKDSFQSLYNRSKAILDSLDLKRKNLKKKDLNLEREYKKEMENYNRYLNGMEENAPTD